MRCGQTEGALDGGLSEFEQSPGKPLPDTAEADGLHHAHQLAEPLPNHAKDLQGNFGMLVADLAEVRLAD